MGAILLVEDDPDQCHEYAIYLISEEGGAHDVDEAQSATSAVEMLQVKDYDLVLLDIMMAFQPQDEKNPDINDQEVDYGRKMGLHVYNKIKEMSKSPPIAVISVVRELAVLAEFPDVVGHLPKYFSLDQLGGNVRKWLKRS